jgi:hypothetical protein
MKLKTLIYSSIAAVLLTAPAAYAQTLLANWTFESLPSTLNYPPGVGVATTNFYADAGAQAGVAAITGWHFGFGTNVYSSPAGHPGRSLSCNGWTNDPGDYYQAQVSTLGYQNIIVTFDQYSSGTGPGNFYLAYSTDGVNFTQFGDIYTVAASAWTSYTNDLSAIDAITNQPVVYFRLVDANNTSAGGGTVGTSGTDRIDNFGVAGINPGQTSVTPVSQSTNIFFGDAVTLNVSGGGSPPLNYQWYYPDLNTPLTDGNSTYGSISGSGSSSLYLTFVDTNQAGTYYVVVTGSSGSSTGQVDVAVSVRTPIVTTIANVRTLLDPTTWTPTDTTNLYTVQGIVTTPSNMTGSTNAQFYMQDGSAGIVVYISGGAGLLPSAGDEVQVTGPLDEFYGQLEFNMSALNPAQNITDISSGNPLPAPMLFDPANAGNIAYMKSIESSLVVVSNVFLEDGGTASFISGDIVNLTNLSNVVFPLYVSPYVYDVIANPVPTFAASITGVLAQHASGNVYTNGFQLVMTQYADLVPGDVPLLPIPLLTDYTAGTLTLSWSDASFTLQSSTNIAGPYADVPGASSPFATNPADSDQPVQFFRLYRAP